jgi:hypothetical protein
MTLDDALDAYAAGLDQVLLLLRQVDALAQAQRAAFARGELVDLAGFAARRAELMHKLSAEEARIAPWRARMQANQAVARRLPAFALAESRSREATRLIAELIDHDRAFLSDLEVTLEDRRREAHDLDTGGATLAAYRRVVAPSRESAGLFDSRG